jgi:formate dehydrogenase subunit delta
MTARQVEHLVRMANQIALNLAPWGDEEAVANKTREHIEKFWTIAMQEELMAYWRGDGEGVSPVVARFLSSQDQGKQTIGS